MTLSLKSSHCTLKIPRKLEQQKFLLFWFLVFCFWKKDLIREFTKIFISIYAQEIWNWKILLFAIPLGPFSKKSVTYPFQKEYKNQTMMNIYIILTHETAHRNFMKAKTLLDFWCISAFLIFVENCRKFLKKANCKGSYFVWSLINIRYRTQTSQKKSTISRFFFKL